MVISYLDEEQDADDAVRDVEQAGRQALKFPGDIGNAAHCRALVAAAIDRFGKLDILVNNGAFQAHPQDHRREFPTRSGSAPSAPTSTRNST